MILTILKLTFCLAGSYFSLSAGCEYRAYRGGHKYVKAFPAKSPYQRFFTLMQCEKDILKADVSGLCGRFAVHCFRPADTASYGIFMVLRETGSGGAFSFALGMFFYGMGAAFLCASGN